MSAFDLAAAFLVLIAGAGWLNARFLHRPPAVVMVLGGLAGAGLLLLAKEVLPAPNAASTLVQAIESLDFPRTVIGYMLAFLLFAGAMQVSLPELRRRLTAVASLATFGVAASTVVVGFGLWLAAHILGLALTMPWAFVFGALISPTDPIAVLAAVRQGSLSKGLEAVLQGEALFNDGVGIVVFSAALAFADGAGALNPAAALGEVSIEALGGLALGWAAAWVVIRIMRAIDDYAVEVSLSLALAVGVYALATALHLSGPIAVVVAGLMIGDCAASDSAMSETTQRHLRGFWTLIDENLNAMLFLLLGLELLVIPFDLRLAGLWLAAILLVVLTRVLVVLPWGAYFRFRHQERGASLLLTWGGLHGALSLAMALSLPPGAARQIVLSTTFAVVIFSVLAQGLTFGRLAAAIARRSGIPGPSQA
ncbi:MAG TPA: sodium:proton antiporter [Phenylobacterium sp.]|jgi:CPA1 family monovalent cation:H+ antiporter|nr:sodium:proton antiporter [Phenylobacterium sp.]